MPRYPGYRYASEFQRLRLPGVQHGHPVDDTLEVSFLRVFRDETGLLRAGLHPHPQAVDTDHWDQGTTLTDASNALEAAAEHPGNETLQQERLLVAAYQRLWHDTTTPRNFYVPTHLRPWAALFTLQGRPILLHVQAATETGARYAAIETARLLIRDQEEATFTRME